MNKRPLKPCRRPGCSNLTRNKGGYCDEHTHVPKNKVNERKKHYDVYKRDKRYSDFYNSPEWTRVRKYILILYNGIDIYAYYIQNKIVIANTVHHIIELRDDWEKRLDVDNLFPLSDDNHNVIHALYRRDKEGTQRLLFRLLERYRKEFNLSPLP